MPRHIWLKVAEYYGVHTVDAAQVEVLTRLGFTWDDGNERFEKRNAADDQRMEIRVGDSAELPQDGLPDKGGLINLVSPYPVNDRVMRTRDIKNESAQLTTCQKYSFAKSVDASAFCSPDVLVTRITADPNAMPVSDDSPVNNRSKQCIEADRREYDRDAKVSVDDDIANRIGSFIRASREIYEDILMYCAVDIENLHMTLDGAGIHVSKEVLKQYLEGEGIGVS